MPAGQVNLWWEVRAGRPTARVAASVVTAVRRYALPAILAAFDDLDPEPDRRASFGALFGARPDDDGGGADPSAWFVQPRGTDFDDEFKDLTSGNPEIRVEAAFDLARSIAVDAVATAPRDPRVLPALLDRLRRDPEPAIRKVIATRSLAAEARSPQVRAALEATATDDGDPGVRWAARYALRLTRTH